MIGYEKGTSREFNIGNSLCGSRFDRIELTNKDFRDLDDIKGSPAELQRFAEWMTNTVYTRLGPNSRLTSCPFCGGTDLEVHTDKITHGPDRVQVCCNTCLTCGPIDDTEIGARIEWNSRPTPLQ